MTTTVIETPSVALESLPEPVSLAGLTAEQAIARLHELRAANDGPVVIEAPVHTVASRHHPVPHYPIVASDLTEVDGRAYAGWEADGAWYFHPTSLLMACWATGWTVRESLNQDAPRDSPSIDEMRRWMANPHGETLRWVLT